MLTDEKEKLLREIFDTQLEEENLEDILEDYDIDPVDALIYLFNSGWIDPEVFGEFLNGE